MKKIFTIYRATNLENGKTYVGFDSNWPSRKNRHVSHSRTNKKSGHFVNAIRKHGEENFVWDVLYQSLNGDHCLNIMENYFIVENDSFGANGYNLTLGGEGPLGVKPSAETRMKISLAGKSKRKPLSVETKTKISLAKKGKTQSSEHLAKLSLARKGKTHSDETKRKMSLAQTKRRETEGLLHW